MEIISFRRISPEELRARKRHAKCKLQLSADTWDFFRVAQNRQIRNYWSSAVHIKPSQGLYFINIVVRNCELRSLVNDMPENPY